MTVTDSKVTPAGYSLRVIFDQWGYLTNFFSINLRPVLQLPRSVYHSRTMGKPLLLRNWLPKLSGLNWPYCPKVWVGDHSKSPIVRKWIYHVLGQAAGRRMARLVMESKREMSKTWLKDCNKKQRGYRLTLKKRVSDRPPKTMELSNKHRLLRG